MKKLALGFLAMALIFSACNSSKKEEKVEHNHSKTSQDSTENVMMKIMTDGMQAMMSVKPSGNIDYDFASKMKYHHQAAVAMAASLMITSKDADLISFCTDVVGAQQSEIGLFDVFLKKEPLTKSKDFEVYEKTDAKAMDVMMQGMHAVKLTDNMDKDFVALMIPHHQSAVEMAKAYLPYSTDKTLKEIATNIVKTQTDEIEWLKSKL
jgi:uncharacterized protein (DUF305 family)